MSYFRAWQGRLDAAGVRVFELRLVVRALLQHFHANGLVYTDLHWRHLAEDAEGNVLLIDLGDVRKREGNENADWIRDSVRRWLWDCQDERCVMESDEEALHAMFDAELAGK
jgi:hypothetical protein